MIVTAKALYDFFSTFGIPAYTEDNVPDEADLPYLTYPLTEPEWSQQATFHVNVYYRNQNSSAEALAKADEIMGRIGTGVRITFPEGLIVLWPQSPNIQVMPPNGDVRAVYINLSINAYHMPGE